MKHVRLYPLLFFCLGLLIIRFVQTHQLSFFFLLWNLFLAWVPLFLLRFYKPTQAQRHRNLILLLALLFLPNAPYIVTDLFHLTKKLVAPRWFDTLLVLSFALLGLFLFLRAFEQILLILQSRISHSGVLALSKAAILLSNGYGIYLGRYLRFNSWDFFCNPFELFESLFGSVFDPKNYKETLAISLAFSVFLHIIFEIYIDFKKGLKGSINDLPEK